MAWMRAEISFKLSLGYGAHNIYEVGKDVGLNTMKRKNIAKRRRRELRTEFVFQFAAKKELLHAFERIRADFHLPTRPF